MSGRRHGLAAHPRYQRLAAGRLAGAGADQRHDRRHRRHHGQGQRAAGAQRHRALVDADVRILERATHVDRRAQRDHAHRLGVRLQRQ
ncbi:conserved hypothetical protein, partial [Ricinus communis]